MELVEPKHPALHTVANINPFETDINWIEHEQEMIKLMHDKIGIGLAAPQLGHSYKMFVMTHSSKGDIGLYNPQILASSEESVVMQEGCLTFPLLFLHISRPKEVMVRYQTVDQEIVEEKFDGLDARVFQHEHEHLQGKTYLDNASDLKLQRAMKKREKAFKRLGI
tara:strand:- start:2531 stop:3028 length:498 start_codon:yes stop_codon:yes gene_type:complete